MLGTMGKGVLTLQHLSGYDQKGTLASGPTWPCTMYGVRCKGPRPPPRVYGCMERRGSACYSCLHLYDGCVL